MRATIIGMTAIAMWALLALLTAASGTVPPFQLTAMTFFIGTLTGLVWYRAQGAWPAIPRDRPWAMVAGAGGLFLYHVLYFAALRNAPAVEASLIAYLWPLLIVLGSALLPGERLAWNHIAGGLLGFGGAALIVTGGTGLAFRSEYVAGYGFALACAFTWSTYSLLARRFKDVPSDAVVLNCAATALLSLVVHLAVETTVWPALTTEWIAIALLGLLPVGAAFYTWDHGCKHGDIQILGAASYLAPLLSTLVLIAAGRAQPSLMLLAACLLITLGAMLAAKSMFGKREQPA